MIYVCLFCNSAGHFSRSGSGARNRPPIGGAFRARSRIAAKGRSGRRARGVRGRVEIDPAPHRRAPNLGVIFARLGQYDQAIVRYGQALAIDPKEHSIRLNLGIAYYQIEKYQQALGEFDQVVKGRPDNVQARFLLGMCLFETGKLKESAAELEKVYGAQPDNTAAAYALATAYLLDDQVEKGRALINNVFRKLGSAEAHLVFGLLNLARRELPPAIEELKRATQLNPKLPTAHAQLGVAYLLSGVRELAIQEFKQEL